VDARKIQNSQTIPKIKVSESPMPQIDNINDYFGNTEARAKAWAQAGKNLQAASRSSSSSSSTVVDNSITCNWPIYVVEFKAGRTDFFFLSEGLDVNIGDLVIVEADRGKDLGKVVDNSIRSMDELMQFKQKIEAKMPELYNGNNAIIPKCIYRKAQPSETSMLLVKSEDEQKAMAACRQKIVDRNLPMEVVDTEYQWYYFIYLI
jgi:cell fate regulator YaaT (PSP1 superfamily)